MLRTALRRLGIRLITLAILELAAAIGWALAVLLA